MTPAEQIKAIALMAERHPNRRLSVAMAHLRATEKVNELRDEIGYRPRPNALTRTVKALVRGWGAV